jgi:hypothetical protein
VGNIYWEHNTVISGATDTSGASWITIGDSVPMVDGLYVRHNVVHFGQYGIGASGLNGTSALNTTCRAWDVTDNLVVKGASVSASGQPSGQTYVTSYSSIYDAADIAANNWELSGSYGGRLATDGWTIGVSDWDHFTSRLSGVENA